MIGYPCRMAVLASLALLAFLAVGALALWNALNYGSVHTKRSVHDGEVALHLAVDIVVFTAVLYFTGGATNPFVSLYLVPISLAATSLPARFAWLTVAMCGAGYALLWWRNVPLPPVHARFGSELFDHSFKREPLRRDYRRGHDG